MRKPKTLEEVYDSCLAEGFIEEMREVNVDRVKSLTENAETGISTAQIVIKAISKQAKEWMSVYIGYYEALRMYAESLLAFDKVRTTNHQCLLLFYAPNIQNSSWI